MRIASLQPSVTLTLHALDRLDTLCAVTKYCLEALPDLAERQVPVLRDSWSVDTGEIVAAKPDLVIASVPYRLESLASILKAGLPVLALAPHSLADVYGDIRLIANQVDARQRAEEIIEGMRQRIAAVQAAAPPLLPKTVYCEEWGKPLIHSQPWVAELIAASGGSFVGVPGGQTTAETIAAIDPEVLLFAWCGAGNRVPLARVVEQRGWQDLRAVRSGRVYCIPDEFLNTPAPTLLQGLDCIAAALHPKLFRANPHLVRLQQTGPSVDP